MDLEKLAHDEPPYPDVHYLLLVLICHCDIAWTKQFLKFC